MGFQESNAKMFPVNNVKIFPASNAKMFLPKSVTVFPDRNVRMFLASNVNKFLNRFVKLHNQPMEEGSKKANNNKLHSHLQLIAETQHNKQENYSLNLSKKPKYLKFKLLYYFDIYLFYFSSHV